jgi:hypothetical protein
LSWGWKIRAETFRRIEFIERIRAQYERFGSVTYSDGFEWSALKRGPLGRDWRKSVSFADLPVNLRVGHVIGG